MNITAHLKSATAAMTVASAVCLAAPAHAAVSTYSTQAAFLAAVASAGTDTFDNLAQGSSDASYSRSAGAYAYTATVTDPSAAADTFYTVGSGTDTWLSTDTGVDKIVFSGFGSNVKGIGAQFFGTNIDGGFLAGQPLLLTLTDSNGSTSQTLTGTSITSFMGFVTTGTLVSMTVQLGSGAAVGAWPTVNNLMLAAAVPEPESWLLLSLGLAAFCVMARRRARSR